MIEKSKDVRLAFNSLPFWTCIWVNLNGMMIRAHPQSSSSANFAGYINYLS